MTELSPAEDAKIAEFYAATYPAEVLLAHLAIEANEDAAVDPSKEQQP